MAKTTYCAICCTEHAVERVGGIDYILCPDVPPGTVQMLDYKQMGRPSSYAELGAPYLDDLLSVSKPLK